MANTFTNVLLSLLVPEKSPLARQYFTYSVLLTTSISHHKFELNNAMNVKHGGAHGMQLATLSPLGLLNVTCPAQHEAVSSGRPLLRLHTSNKN